MQVLIFSKNRAMQVDGTLRSFFLHCQDAASANITVLYLAEGGLHAGQYRRLSQDYRERGVCFKRQGRFEVDFWQILLDRRLPPWKDRLRLSLGLNIPRIVAETLAGRPGETILFLVDDNLFVRDFSLAGIAEALEMNPQALGFSLRLGRNTAYCYPLDKPQMLPEFERAVGNVLKYRWVDAEHDFGYPLEVSSSAYRKSDILPPLAEQRFKNPNELELVLSSLAAGFRTSHPELICAPTSLTFCDPVNKVQVRYKNRAAGQEAYTPARLAGLFQDGYRIKVEAYTDFVSNACHQEAELFFEKNE